MVDGRNRRVAVLRATDGTWVRQLTGPPGTLSFPNGVAVVPSTGEVLVSDWDLYQVVRFRSIDDDTVVGTLGTGSGSGPAQFNVPSGLAMLDGSHRPLVCFFTLSSDGIMRLDIPTSCFLLVLDLAGRSRGRGGRSL